MKLDDIRYEALRLALNAGSTDTRTTLATAKAYADFIAGDQAEVTQ